MKNLVFISSLLVALVLGSCSKEDPRPASGSETSTFKWTFNNVSVTANASTTLNGNTIKLTDILSSANKDKEKYLLKVELQYSASNIIINGLPEGQKIKSITIQTSDRAVAVLDLGPGIITGTGASIEYSNNNVLPFLDNVCNSMLKNRSIALNATVSTTEDQAISGVSIVITLIAKLKW